MGEGKSKLVVSVLNRLRSVFQKPEEFEIPSYEVKREKIRNYRNKAGIKIFIETGTFLGDTIENLKGDFLKLYSIELSAELAEKARRRFEDNPKIEIIQGDSGIEIEKLLKNINENCLFWLDGHYSSEFFVGDEYIKTAKGEKDTPVVEELISILKHHKKDHIILIDDARLFTGKNGYPKINSLKELIGKYKSKFEIFVDNDVIHILP